MKRRLLLCALCVLVPASAGCPKSAGVPLPTPAHAPAVEPSPVPEQVEEGPREMSEVFVAGDSLVHEGFEVLKLSKQVRQEYTPETGTPPVMLDTTYAVLRRNGRALLKFDGVHSGFGNATDFGLFPFLGGETKQLAVSLTIPRGGRHWAVELSPRPRVIFDSDDYGVGREEFTAIDLDRDGLYEISMPLTAFYGFEDMAPAETPLPEIIFSYNTRAARYLPANELFRDYVLRDVEADTARLKHHEGQYLSDRLDILLRYVYAGREGEGWAFFEREYRRPDRAAMRSKIEAELKSQPLYKLIYKKRTN